MAVGRLVRMLVPRVFRYTSAGMTKGPHLTRYYMYRRISQFHRSRRPEERVLSISHSQHLAQMLGYSPAQVTHANYPECTILDLPLDDASMDAVVSDQVLEHVEGDPQQAIDETYRVLKPGGIAVHTTCFMNRYHNCPGDYWRFTPSALGLLCRNFSTVLETDGWGSRLALLGIEAGLRFAPVPETRWHPLHWLAMHNEPRWPIHVWIIAQK